MKNKILNRQQYPTNRQPKFGFTIIELIVVISVLGILTSIAVLSYNSWKQSVVAAQLKSDLNGAATAMEDARNFGTGYPGFVPSTFTASSNVALNGGSNDGKTFCISAVNSQFPNLIYHLDSDDTQTAKSGICYPDYPPPTTPVVTVALNQNNVRATITAVTCSGSGSPVPQYSTRNRTNDGTWSTYSVWSGTLTAEQVANDGVKYGYQAQARCYTAPSSYSSFIAGVEATYTDSNVTHTDYTASSASAGCWETAYTSTLSHNGWTITAVNYSTDNGYLEGGVGTTSVRGVANGGDCYYTFSGSITIYSVTYHNP